MCLKVMTLFLEVFIEYCQYFFFFFVFNVYANWFSPSSAASSFFHAHFYAFHSGVTSPTSPLYLVSALYIIKVRFFNYFLKFFVVFFFSFAAGHRTFGFLVFSCKEISLSFLFRKKKTVLSSIWLLWFDSKDDLQCDWGFDVLHCSVFFIHNLHSFSRHKLPIT